MNAKDIRAKGIKTIFRNGYVYLVNPSMMTAMMTRIDGGRWMDRPETGFAYVSLSDLSPSLQNDIEATLAVCYCDQGVDTCDFCGGRRTAFDWVKTADGRYIQKPCPLL